MLFDSYGSNTGITCNWPHSNSTNDSLNVKDYLLFTSMTNADRKRHAEPFSGHTSASLPILNNDDYNNNNNRLYTNGNFQMKISARAFGHRHLYNNGNGINKFILMTNIKNRIYKPNYVSITTLSGIDFSMNKNDDNNNGHNDNEQNILDAIDDQVIKNW